LEVGRFKVSFPPDHEPGIIERPTVFTIEWRREDPLKDVIISELSSFGSDYDAWARAVKATGKSAAFIYVHGYNTSFEYAARQAGQLAFDLEIDRELGGVPMLYSWPSRGTLKGYGADYDRSRAAAGAFNRFLDLVKQRAGVSRIHIVAHSMGNRLVANALLDRWVEGRKDKFLGQLVLAAPDVSAEDFRDQFLKTLPQLAKRVTLYVSDNDKALRTSTGLRDGIPRAGLLEGGLMEVTEPGFEVVDATPLPADFLDHSYYSTNRSMLADIYCLLRDSAASGRPLITAAKVNWIFKPAAMLEELKGAACPESDNRQDTSAVPPILQSPAPPANTGSSRLWLVGVLALILVAAAAYVVARRGRPIV
jgi:esterase/lipase superfamily enzyme